MTKQERVWRYIKAADHPVKVAEIADALDIQPGHVSHHIRRLREWCDMTVVGKTRGATYTIPKGAKYGCPGKGSNPASRANLTRWDWQKGLIAIRNKYNYGPRVPQPGITLEQCWPCMKKG